jgi:hypothetical protein
VYFDGQPGPTVEGDYRHPEGYLSHFHATLSGDQSIRIALDDGTIVLTGDLTGA